MIIKDKNILRKHRVTEDRLEFYSSKKIPLMSVVEISNSEMCNRKCSFCPRSDPDYPDINEFISDELHNKIFSELSELKYKGMVIYSGYVEPLLHKKIYENISPGKQRHRQIDFFQRSRQLKPLIYFKNIEFEDMISSQDHWGSLTYTRFLSGSSSHFFSM